MFRKSNKKTLEPYVQSKNQWDARRKARNSICGWPQTWRMTTRPFAMAHAHIAIEPYMKQASRDAPLHCTVGRQ